MGVLISLQIYTALGGPRVTAKRGFRSLDSGGDSWGNAPMEPLRLSPSDFAFLWEQCRRCFYLKVVHGIRQPSMPMASIFKKLEGLQMGFYDGRRTTELIPALPEGTIRCGERTVESEPSSDGWYVYGKIDSLVEFEDGAWGILDFKTTKVSPEKAKTYSRQLHAYAHAFANPAAKPRVLKGEAPRLSPISRIGLLCFEPAELSLDAEGRQVYRGAAEWVEIPRDDAAFQASVADMMAVLRGPLPGAAGTCDWCAYAERMGKEKFERGAPAPSSGIVCPQCGAPMKERTGRYGSFFGCTRYPDCKGTRKA
jgi:hypothetical protein